jgi:hypothetical protein
MTLILTGALVPYPAPQAKTYSVKNPKLFTDKLVDVVPAEGVVTVATVSGASP